jgi:hypothetical protein
MQYTYELDTRLTDERTSVLSVGTGRFVRSFAIVGWILNAVFIITVLLVFPGTLQSPVAWTPFAMIAVVAGLTFQAGRQVTHR